jgi:hypothetical protein
MLKRLFGWANDFDEVRPANGVAKDDNVFAAKARFFCGSRGEHNRAERFMFGNSGAEELSGDQVFALPIFKEISFGDAEKLEVFRVRQVEHVAKAHRGSEENNRLRVAFFIAGVFGARRAAAAGKVNACHVFWIVPSGFAGAVQPIGRIVAAKFNEGGRARPDGVDFDWTDFFEPFGQRRFGQVHRFLVLEKIAPPKPASIR